MFCFTHLPATDILALSLTSLNSGESPDISHRYVPLLDGDSCSNVTPHLFELHEYVWSANCTPSTLKFMYIGYIMGV